MALGLREEGANSYNFDSRLAIILHGKREWGLEGGALLSQDQERLVRTLALAVLLDR